MDAKRNHRRQIAHDVRQRTDGPATSTPNQIPP